jgi:pimeloyl-ACP methyl ester carboxylesterase
MRGNADAAGRERPFLMREDEDDMHHAQKNVRIVETMNGVVLRQLPVGTGSNARSIAIRAREGEAPGLLWLGGFNSDMKGTKAEAIDGWASEQGRACTRFDYSGHGESSGDFAQGTIGRWLEESVAVFSTLHGAQVVIGSSMGGWISLLLARELKRLEAAGKAAAARIAGMVLVAPAPDFTEELMWRQFPPEVKREIEEKGSWRRPSAYADQGYLITKSLIEDGRKHLILGGLIETGCPVRILQGVQDEDVPWQHAVELVSRIARDDVVLTLVKDGDHRLSRPEDIARLIDAVVEVA